MNKENLLSYFPLFAADWSILIKLFFIVIVLLMISVAIYDRFIQRKNQLLINYPLIGRMRYLFYLLRCSLGNYPPAPVQWYNAYTAQTQILQMNHSDTPHYLYRTKNILPESNSQ